MKKKSVWYFSAKERVDLLISWVTLSMAFALVISPRFLSFFTDLEAILIAFISVGTGFVFHELAHRQAARNFGFHSEFRMWKEGLILAVVMAVISGGRFIFAAPGATYFYGRNVSRKQNGIISVAGPITNVAVGLALVGLVFVTGTSFLGRIVLNAAWINFWFAFFNMLPFYPLDGAKVMAWKPGLWVAIIAVSAAMAFLPIISLSAG